MDEPIDNYLDIINLPYPHPTSRQPMPMSARAAQFSSFAALTGHEEMLAETARHTSQAIELSPDESAALSRRLNNIMTNHPDAKVAIRHFMPDSNKSGGKYVITIGHILHIAPDTHELILTEKTAIPMQSIISVRTISKRVGKEHSDNH